MARKIKKQLLLEELEKDIKSRGVKLAYERLSFAGLKLRSGLCWFKGTYYIFVDRLLPVQSRIDLLQGAIEELDLLAVEGRLDNPHDVEDSSPGTDPETA